MEALQRERNELLLYCLLHPPPHVRIALPANVESLADLDLTAVPSPLPVFTQCAGAAGDRGSRTLRYTSGLGTEESVCIDLSPYVRTASKPKAKRRRHFFRDVRENLLHSSMAGIGLGLSMWPSSRETSVAHSASGEADRSCPTLLQGHSLDTAPRRPPPLSTSALAPDTSLVAPQLEYPMPLTQVDARCVDDLVPSAPYEEHCAQPFPRGAPRIPEVRVQPVIGRDVFDDFTDHRELTLIVYEHILLATDLLMGPSKRLFEPEVLRAYRVALDVSEAQHMTSLASLMPPSLHKLKGRPSKEVLDRELALGAAFIQAAAARGGDGEFSVRYTKLLGVIQRHQLSSAASSGGNSSATTNSCTSSGAYPLALRCMLYTMALRPLYTVNGESAALDEVEVSNTLLALRCKLDIPDELEPYCRLHAQLTSLEGAESGTPVQAQCDFFGRIAQTVSALPEEQLDAGPLDLVRKYKLFVLQETLEMCCAPMFGLESILTTEVLRSVLAVFVETCLSLPPRMLLACMQLDGQAVLPRSATTYELLVVLLSAFSTVMMLSGFNNRKAAISQCTTFRDFVVILNELKREPQSYCRMLSGRMDDGDALMLPGLFKICSHFLATRWEVEYHDGSAIPADFRTAMEDLFTVLQKHGIRRLHDNASVTSVIRCAAKAHLSWLKVFFQRESDMSAAEQHALLQSIRATLVWDTELSAAIPKCFPTPWVEVRRPMAPFITARPEACLHARIQQAIAFAQEIVSIVQGPLVVPTIDEAGPVAAQGFLRHARLTVQLGFRLKSTVMAMPLPELVQRLNTMISGCGLLYDQVVSVADRYDAIRRVSGAPPYDLQEVEAFSRKLLQKPIDVLCECLVVRVLYGDLHATLFQRFLRTDLKAYKALKKDKQAVAAMKHLPRAHPSLTTERVLQHIKAALHTFLPLVNDVNVQEEVTMYMCLHFCSVYTTLVLEGDGCFYFPEEQKSFLMEVNSIQSFFFDHTSHAPEHAPSAVWREAAEVIVELRTLLLEVFGQSSRVLVEGDSLVQPMSALPEYHDSSPWCKFVVRHILQRRKDKYAKQFQ